MPLKSTPVHENKQGLQEIHSEISFAHKISHPKTKSVQEESVRIQPPLVFSRSSKQASEPFLLEPLKKKKSQKQQQKLKRPRFIP